MNRPRGSCDPGDSDQFALLDDLDAIATATPQPGGPYSGTWIVPSNLPAAGYVVAVEVSKEFDTNDTYAFPSSEGPLDSMYPDLTYGLRGNLGQPSVVYKVPVSLVVGDVAASATSAGHGDPQGAAGTLFPADGTLSTDLGSGEGRLAMIAGPSGTGRLHVEVDACPVESCETALPLAQVAADVARSQVTSTTAVVEIRQEATSGLGVLDYEIRYRPLPSYDHADPAEVPRWIPGPTLAPDAPGALSPVTLKGLSPDRGYVLAVTAKGVCGDSPPTLVRFFTPATKYVTLSGCFIVTAAFEEGTVAAVRQLRDHLVRRSGIAAAAADLYYRTAPPLADLIRRSETARAVTRTWLGAPVAAARAIAAGLGGPPLRN